MESNPDDYLMLSGIQHFEFCRRQWALIHIEQQWEENLRTVEGEWMHRNAHNGYFTEKRGDIIITRDMPVYSRIMEVTGKCDIVEFQRADEGIMLHGREGTYKVYPVEYKRGEPKENNSDVLQLTAQAMCLEEMMSCEINEGAIFYGEIRRRMKVEFSRDLREKVKSAFSEMHQYYNRRYTPKVKFSKACNACSLKNICLPKLGKNKSAQKYIQDYIGGDE